MQVAQTWRERTGMERVPEWDVLIEKLSPLAYNDEQLYLAAETAVDTYKDIRLPQTTWQCWALSASCP